MAVGNVRSSRSRFYNRMMRALILVDLQNDFVPGGALAVREGDRVIPIANALQAKFSRVLGTQDWHPANHGSFAASHPGKKPGEVIDLNGLPQILWPVHCLQNTRGGEFVAGLERGRIKRVFQKGIDPGIDSYSCFFDNARRRSTGLAEYLQAEGIRMIYIMGLATDYCVKFSVLDAISLGLETIVIADGCRGVNLHVGDDERAFDEMRSAGARIITSNQVEAEA